MGVNMINGKSIVLINNQRCNVTVIITIMSLIAVCTFIGHSNRLVGALAVPKMISTRRVPTITITSSSSSALLKPCGSVRFISRPSRVHMMMSIVEDVTAEMKVAMKAKDSVTLGTIRLIRAAFANAAIELRTENLNDEQVRFVQYATFFMMMCFIT